jgi:hypothetical protein
MNRLTRFTLAAVAVFTLCSASVFAQTPYSGIYGVGVVLSDTLSGVASFNLYALTDLGDSNLNSTFTPTGGSGQGNTLGSPYINNTNGGSGTTSTWASGSGPSLGTFNIANGDALTLNGGEEVTYKGPLYEGSANVSGADLFYSINASGFADAPLTFNQDLINGSTNYNYGSDNQRWYIDSLGVNVLSGLSNGTYTLSVYFRDSNSDDGNDYVSNSSNNYNATFTVVPEPSTLMMLMSSSVFGSFYLLRRRRK